MAISTYAELVTAIGNWSDRTDLASRIPEFIALAEAKFNRKLRLYRMEAITTGTLSAATDTISFPSDMAALSKVQINSSATYILEQMSKELLIRKYPSSGTGIPSAFTINGNQIEVKPIADGDYTYELTYFQKITALSDTNTTNWLLSLYPDAYLYGALLELSPYLKDSEETQVWATLYRFVVEEITASDNRDRYSGGSLRARAL